MNGESRKRLVREFMCSNISKRMEDLELSDDENIIVAGIVDSLSIMKLIDYLEKTFKINIFDEEIIPENFESIEKISSYLQGKQNVDQNITIN